jgi:predicted NUDIX family phosphoesterase
MMPVDEQIMVVERAALVSEANGGEPLFHGFRAASVSAWLGAVLRHARFTDREPAERNPDLKQPIPYIVVTRGDAPEVLLYRRLSGGKETRLHDKFSIGVGGHVNPVDETAGDFAASTVDPSPFLGQLPPDVPREQVRTLLNTVLRELDEEIALDDRGELRLLGFLNNDSDSVGQVHFGLVFNLHFASTRVESREKRQLAIVGWFRRADLAEYMTKMETWSQLVAQTALPLLEKPG